MSKIVQLQRIRRDRYRMSRIAFDNVVVVGHGDVDGQGEGTVMWVGQFRILCCLVDYDGVVVVCYYDAVVVVCMSFDDDDDVNYVNRICIDHGKTYAKALL